MIGGRDAICRGLAAAMLALGLLAPLRVAVAIEGLVAEGGRAAWSPDRHAAVIASGRATEDDASAELEAAQYEDVATEVEIIPEQGVLANSRLMSRRPANLARPAPWTRRNYISNRQPEALPSPTDRDAPIMPEGLPVPPTVGMMHEHGSYESFHECGPGCNSCCGTWDTCGPAPICCLLPRFDCRSLELSAGVHGFTGPANRGGGGSFGFHEGINWGSSVCGCGAFQFGGNWTHSNFEGNYLTDESRHQAFVTGGWFRRADMGLQGGVVIDYYHQDWDFELDLVQLRGEVSWKFCCPDEFGFWFTQGLSDDIADARIAVAVGPDDIRIATQGAEWESNDLYSFFWRRQFACGGEGRIFGGFTGASQGLMGADAQAPLNPCWNLRAGFLYVVPLDGEQQGIPDHAEETWNVSVSLVWTPYAGNACGPNYCRPLFNVADNGSFATQFAQ